MAAKRERRPKHPSMGTAQLAAVAELFGVLSEPSRLRMLQMLQAGEASVGQLVARSGMKQANVSKQLGMLAAAGIVGRRQEGNRVIYRIDMPLVFELCSLVCNGVTRRAFSHAKALSRK